MDEKSVPLVGLTGGMGAGKSTALELLAELGAKTLSTDAVVHELYGDPRVREAVVARWGPEVAPDGVVDRAAIAARAFAGEAGERGEVREAVEGGEAVEGDEAVEGGERAWLEQLLWPLVGERMAQWIAQARAQTPPPSAAVIEVPLLFEANMDGAFDATIAVVAEEALRRERAEGRGHALAEERHARQLSQQEKAQRATFVVRNDGSVQDMRRELAAILAKLSM